MPKDPKDSPPPIFAAQRQERIAALVTSRGRIHLDELASVFEVSQPTLRKDLNILARQGLVKRTHGGALSTRAPAERDIMTRFVQNVEAKQAIGLACCDFVEEGEAIYLDCGTTTHHVAQHLATRGWALSKHFPKSSCSQFSLRHVPPPFNCQEFYLGKDASK